MSNKIEIGNYAKRGSLLDANLGLLAPQPAMNLFRCFVYVYLKNVKLDLSKTAHIPAAMREASWDSKDPDDPEAGKSNSCTFSSLNY